MGRFYIQGGQSLAGTIRPQGAKNEALQVLCATLLSTKSVTLHNIPDIEDVRSLLDMLQDLGIEIIKSDKHSYQICAKNATDVRATAPTFLSKISSLRGSIMLLAPMLVRFKKVVLVKPGGDKIGRRRIDTHIHGLVQLGAQFEYDRKKERYTLRCAQLHGTDILLEEASVTGTANLIMAACFATGRTQLYPAACEPYVQQLCHFLVSMGAKIEGIATNRLHIQGTSFKRAAVHYVQSDIIEVGSFIGLAALMGTPLRIEPVHVQHMRTILHMFKHLGIKLRAEQQAIQIEENTSYTIQHFIDGSLMTLQDGIWPALSPDMISVGIVTALQAEGAVLFHQRMFESRLFFVDRLIQMGGRLILCDPHRVTVIGLARKQRLYGIRMSSPDIRAGIALLLAALSAEGESCIENIEQIDRGYEDIDQRLNALGAHIERS